MPTENKTLARLTLLGLALAAALFYAYARSNAPDKSAVNGTYYNKCCGNVVLRDGGLYYKKVLYKYDLENMKFGLTAFVPGNFTERGIVPSSDNTVFSFFAKDGKFGFTITMRRQEYSFLQVK
jgi:hypothetical protein